LADGDSLCEAIGFEKVPHFTTLQKAADRLLMKKSFRRLITASVERSRKVARCIPDEDNSPTAFAKREARRSDEALRQARLGSSGDFGPITRWLEVRS
jgi:hypothetical protein